MIITTIKEIRKEKKITQTEAAKMVGISQSMYSAIENLTRRPSPKIAKKIAKLFGFDWTIFYEEQNKEKGA